MVRMKAPSGARAYFFEVFTVANLVALLLALKIRRIPVWNLGAVALEITCAFLLQALIGVAIRLAFAVRKGTTRELLEVYRLEVAVGASGFQARFLELLYGVSFGFAQTLAAGVATFQ